MLTFKQFIKEDRNFSDRLKKSVYKQQLDPEQDCASIATAVYKAHGNKFNYYSLEDKKGRNHKLRHVYMHDPKTNTYFDGGGKTTQKRIEKRFKSNTTSVTKQLDHKSRYLDDSPATGYWNHGGYQQQIQHNDLLKDISQKSKKVK